MGHSCVDAQAIVDVKSMTCWTGSPFVHIHIVGRFFVQVTGMLTERSRNGGIAQEARAVEEKTDCFDSFCQLVFIDQERQEIEDDHIPSSS